MSKLSLVSWNINGIRAIVKKDFIANIKKIDPDILCLQETKGQAEDVRTILQLLPGYHTYVNSSKNRKGYAGTAILSKQEPLAVTFDINYEDHDLEGRVITAAYENFYLVNVYTPNSGRGLVRLGYRATWDEAFLSYIKGLEKDKPVIVCGDLNVAHQAIDIARAKQNYNKSAGYTQQEIDGFSNILNSGFLDTFRHLHPDDVKYTYWNYMFNARSRNVGWRIDYFLISDILKDRLIDSTILNEYDGSDHCPVKLEVLNG